jgi:hypothetical protein
MDDLKNRQIKIEDKNNSDKMSEISTSETINNSSTSDINKPSTSETINNSSTNDINKPSANDMEKLDTLEEYKTHIFLKKDTPGEHSSGDENKSIFMELLIN